MNLGEKIKRARKSKGMTQEQLAGDIVTRNMVCKIESGKANPSLSTLIYLADTLGVSLPYLLSDDDDAAFYEKKKILDDIYKAYTAKKYLSVINRAKVIAHPDNELAYILAECYFREGVAALKRGSMRTADTFFTKCISASESTAISTSHFTDKIPMYSAICHNINAPLLELDVDTSEKTLTSDAELEFFRYLTNDLDYDYRDPCFKYHVNAKKLIKGRNYASAIPELLKTVETVKETDYNAYVIYSVYCDLENCYKQLYDFENAYAYASKKLSLIEGFKS